MLPHNPAGKQELEGDSLLIFGVKDSVPNEAILVGTTEVYSPLFWIESSYHSPFFLMIHYAIPAVHQAGGNAIKIIGCSATKLQRLKLSAKIYSLNEPAYSQAWNARHPRSPANSDSLPTIVHIKGDYYDAGSDHPIPIFLNDSLVGHLWGHGFYEHKQYDYVAQATHSGGEMNLVSGRGGTLSIKDRYVWSPDKMPIQTGKEYYFLIQFWGAKSGGFYLKEVGKFEFENNLVRY
jgi:hypothetical protein